MFSAELDLWLILGVLIIFPSILAIREYRHRYKNNDYYQLVEGEKLPDLLQQSTLFLNEENIRSHKPFKLYGRVDQVFKTPDDVLMLLDTKCRKKHRIYESDIEQLSIYAFILRTGNYGHKVAKKAYIRTVVIYGDNKKTVNYFLVNLYNDEKLIEILRNKTTEQNNTQLQPKEESHV